MLQSASHNLNVLLAVQALKTRWKISMFTEYEPPAEEPLLVAGSVIRLYHPESATAVAVGSQCPNSGKHQVLMQGFDEGEPDF